MGDIGTTYILGMECLHGLYREFVVCYSHVQCVHDVENVWMYIATTYVFGMECVHCLYRGFVVFYSHVECVYDVENVWVT